MTNAILSFGALLDFSLCRNLYESEIFLLYEVASFVVKNAMHSIIVFNSMTLTITYIYTATKSRQSKTWQLNEKTGSGMCQCVYDDLTFHKKSEDERVHTSRQEATFITVITDPSRLNALLFLVIFSTG